MNEDRIEPPSSHDDEEALREYGRQLAIDSLISDLPEARGNQAEPASNVITPPVSQWKRRFWIGAAAAAVAGLASLPFWNSGNETNTGHLAALSPSWQLTVSDGADYQILAPNHVKLLKGELRFSSRQAADLMVDTPHARAQASGTDFLIGHHKPNQSRTTTTKPNTDMNMNELSRLLVLAGSVSLTTAHGSVTANKNEAAVAAPDKSPEKLLVEANSSFAFECYAQLAKENTGENLFFSPYSISNALLMMAEGARGETALEMGEVLGFPAGLRRIGNEAQQIPWEMSVIHAGQAGLNQAFNGGAAHTEKEAALRAEIAELEKQVEGLAEELREASAAGKRRDSDEVQQLRKEYVSARKELPAKRRELDAMGLRVANAVWGDENSEFNEPWKTTVSKTYGTGAVKPANFTGNPEGERQRINAWVASQTENRIPELFGPGAIVSDTNLVLANAVYFKATWLNPFEKEQTHPGEFQLASGKTSEVSLMNKSTERGIRYAAFNGDGSFFESPKEIPVRGPQPQKYPGKEGFSLVEMPYLSGKRSMVVIAPNDPAGLAKLEAELNPTQLSKWLGALRMRETIVSMPKFEMKSSYDLNGTLSAMGMPKAFAQSTADFSGISSADDNFIDLIVHQAFITVDEEGTEAAAATGAALTDRSIKETIPFVPVFRADRPFIYVIRDVETGTILFLGRILDPNL